MKNRPTQPSGNRLDKETLDILKATDYTGQVTQIQEGLVYVGFRTDDAWLTQVFKEDELEAVAL